jgi:cardiolipin synthase
MMILKRAGVAVGILAFCILSLVGTLSMTRGTPVSYVLAPDDRSGPPSVSDSLFARTIELFTGAHLSPGNRVEVLANGVGTYPKLWRDIRAAQHTITVQMYYSMPGAIADSMAVFLRERARAGVRVRLLLDAFGSGPLTNEWVEGLRGDGVLVAWLRPVHWYTLHKAAQRSHARIVVVDGRVGYTGGFGLADYWQGSGHAKDQWRETNVRFEGESVAQLQAAFTAGWAEATGELLTGDAFFPPATFRPVGTVNGAVLHTEPTLGSTEAERFLALTIAGARKSLYIANSYFVPDDDFRGLLLRSAKRGVDVRVLTAGPETDIQTTYYAGRARYEELLAGGVRVYEYLPTMMHAKTIVVDGVWMTIGSMNFDNRSMAFNNESNFIALDRTVGATMDSLFFDDLKHSKEIDLDEFRRRPWYHRPLELGATLLSRVL